MESIAVKISKEIETIDKTFEEDLLKFSTTIEKLATEKDESIDYFDRLEKLGFGAIPGMRKAQTQNVKLTEKRKLEESVSRLTAFYKRKFPLFQIISLKDMMFICEKYNLIFGSVSFYKNLIPVKNLQDVELFKTQYRDIERGVFESNGNPLFLESKTDTGTNYNSTPYFHITAPKSHFNLDKKTTIIGTCIYSNDHISSKDTVKQIRLSDEERRRQARLDPIIWVPVAFPMIGGACLIVTKWGDEASYPEFANGIEN